MKQIKLPEMNPEHVAKEIGDFIVEAILKVKSTGGVVGLSGGVDSTTVAALAKKAFEEYNARTQHKLEVVGYVLPSSTNNSKDTEDGIRIAEKLCIRYEVHSIEPIVQAFIATNPEALQTKYHRGNLTSRIRANVLSTKAATEHKTILGTGNKDEDFGVGYYTLFGDGAVHLSPIGNLPKRLVKQMAAYFGFPEIAKKQSSPGLEPGQTSFADLGYSYETVELVLEAIKQGLTLQEISEQSLAKGQILPELQNNPKFSTIEGIINDVLYRHHTIALPKSEIVHPPIAPVSLRYTW